MTATILSGIEARNARLPKLIETIGRLSRVPRLVIVQVGDRHDSTAYINAKKSFAKKAGIEVELVHFPETVTQDEVIKSIKDKNSTESVSGIIVQLPLPAHIDPTPVIESIDPRKDVDGLTQANYLKLINNEPGIVPATARGVNELLAHYNISLRGKKVAVVGRSRLVGTPIAVLCKRAGAEVIVCHSKTINLAQETSQADVVIVAVGRPGLITSEHVKPGAVVIDVGISKLTDGSIKGDADFDALKEKASAITPVPGGVGPMTVLGLFENVAEAVL